MDQEDLVPYRVLGPHAACVLVGHGHYPALDDGVGSPASLSPRLVGGLLRSRLGFRGLVLTDDLEMGAVDDYRDEGRDAVEALGAGCDLLLYCRNLDRAARAGEALERAAAYDPSLAGRLESSRKTVERTAAAWPRQPADAAAWTRARDALREAALA